MRTLFVSSRILTQIKSQVQWVISMRMNKNSFILIISEQIKCKESRNDFSLIQIPHWWKTSLFARETNKWSFITTSLDEWTIHIHIGSFSTIFFLSILIECWKLTDFHIHIESCFENVRTLCQQRQMSSKAKQNDNRWNVKLKRSWLETWLDERSSKVKSFTCHSFNWFDDPLFFSIWIFNYCWIKWIT